MQAWLSRMLALRCCSYSQRPLSVDSKSIGEAYWLVVASRYLLSADAHLWLAWERRPRRRLPHPGEITGNKSNGW